MKWRAHTRTHTDTHTYTHTDTHTPTQTHTLSHTHTHAYTHTHSCVLVQCRACNICRFGQNRVYGVYDRMVDEILANNTVYRTALGCFASN